uniref:Uncharacterized protein n=1 Tax=Arundo donax TaxID=35708 RepID=A0A0A9GEC7_ARUDO
MSQSSFLLLFVSFFGLSCRFASWNFLLLLCYVPKFFHNVGFREHIVFGSRLLTICTFAKIKVH